MKWKEAIVFSYFRKGILDHQTISRVSCLELGTLKLVIEKNYLTRK